jgi:hypothetical protein
MSQRDKPAQGAATTKLELQREGAIGFIDWLDASAQTSLALSCRPYCWERKFLSASMDFSKAVGDKISCM